MILRRTNFSRSLVNQEGKPPEKVLQRQAKPASRCWPTSSWFGPWAGPRNAASSNIAARSRSGPGLTSRQAFPHSIASRSFL